MKKELRDYDPEIDSDEVWDLLSQTTRAVPSPEFAKRVLQEITKEDTKEDLSRTQHNILTPDHNEVNWWQRSRKKITLFSMSTAAACVIIGMSLYQTPEVQSTAQSGPPHPSKNVTQATALPVNPHSTETHSIDVVNSVLSTEIILVAAGNPTLYSNEQLSSLIGF